MYRGIVYHSESILMKTSRIIINKNTCNKSNKSNKSIKQDKKKLTEKEVLKEYEAEFKPSLDYNIEKYKYE